MTLPDGSELSVGVEPKAYARSVHASIIACTDCHTNIKDYPHPELHVRTRRQFELAMSEVCKNCHFEQYTRRLDGIHYKLLASGNKSAPVCVDCHGSHYIVKPDRLQICRACSRCHKKIYTAYAKSVHGQALLERGNTDVPDCIDCHTAHTIADPRTDGFRLKVPELCGRCHTNRKLMARYHLSTNVLQTYLQDFHGTSIRYYGEEGHYDSRLPKPVCTDCHGVHDIGPPDSKAMKHRLVTTCRRCHKSAKADFPNAWLPHYNGTLSQAPLVYLINLGYKILIPFILIGLVVQIFLHLWRVVINR